MIYQEKIFTEDECNKIIDFSKIYNANPSLRKAEPNIDFKTNRVDSVIYKNGEKLGKRFFAHDILRNENTEWLFEKLFKWFENVSNILLSPNTKKQNISLLKYETGDFFTKHTDIYKNFEWRRWTLNIQLDNKYDGGDYIIYLENGEMITLSKEPGTAIAYWSGYEHEIKEITNGIRYSIVTSLSKNMIIEKTNKLI
jgi:hypothetical protein